MQESTAPALWAKLRAAQPRLLRNTPTRGRHIAWDEIDGAELPLFGDTRRSELPPNPRFEVAVGGEDGAAGEAEGDEVRRLRAMGFERAACVLAVESSNDAEEALAQLLALQARTAAARQSPPPRGPALFLVGC